MSAPAKEIRVELPYEPKPHQRAAHALLQVARFVVLVWHRRAGKTVFAVMELVLAALACMRERGRYGYIAPFLGQAKEIAWTYLLAFTAPIPGRVVNVSELSVTLPNGARIRLYGADNPDALRGGYFDGLVLDEAGDMRREVWGEIVRPMLADREGWCIFIGTPRGVNLFSELFFAAIAGRDGWAGDLRRAEDTGMISPAEIEAARNEMSASEFAAEFDCDFQASQSNILIPLHVIQAAMRRSAAPREYEFAPKILGIDVAREGDDRSAFFPRQGLVAFKPQTLRSDDLMHVADQAAALAQRWQPDAIFVDYGMGVGVSDRLRQLGFPSTDVQFGSNALEPRFRNRRTEMWWKMAEWLKGGGCLPDAPDLLVELSAPTHRHRDDRGQMALEKKADLKKRIGVSPDVADALALTFAAPVAIRTALDRANERFGPQAHDYDPFAERRA